MKYLLLLCLSLSLSIDAFAQPKLYLKAYGGAHITTTAFRAENKQVENIEGWHAGLAFRLSYQKIFAEFDLDYYNTGIAVFLESSSLVTSNFDKTEFRLKGLSFPLVAGWIPVKTPFFKWYLSSGPAMRFNLRAKEIDGNTSTNFKPKDLQIYGTKLDWTFGTQFDIGWINLRIMYLIGVTNATRTSIRTNTNEFRFTAGLLI